MIKEWKDKWVAALRSGNYEQGKYCLRSKQNTYCCLGVLCDIYDNKVWSEHNSYFTYNGDSQSITRVMREALELPTHHSSIVDDLMDKNDAYNETFSNIANFIEENL